MQTYPHLSGQEQWRLLCWMMRHPRALHEDTMAAAPVAQSAPAQRRRRKGKHRSLRSLAACGMLHALLAHLLELPS